MGLGFLLLARRGARSSSPHEVGIAAGVVSAMMLCTQLALLRRRLGGHHPLPASISAVRPRCSTPRCTFVIASAVCRRWRSCSSPRWASRQLDVVAARPLFAMLFVRDASPGRSAILLDQIATALRPRRPGADARGRFARGDRSVGRRRARRPFVTHAGSDGGLRALGGGRARGLRRHGRRPAAPRAAGYRFRPRHRARARAPARRSRDCRTTPSRSPSARPASCSSGARRRELLSPAANATWYAVWMMAWVVYIVPIQVGMTLFAEVAHDPASLAAVRARGRPASLARRRSPRALVLGAGRSLRALAPRPRATRTGRRAAADPRCSPCVPLTFVQAYFAACRARRRLARRSRPAGSRAAVSVGAAAAGCRRPGGHGIAWARGAVRRPDCGRSPAQRRSGGDRSTAGGIRSTRLPRAGPPRRRARAPESGQPLSPAVWQRRRSRGRCLRARRLVILPAARRA